MDLINTNLKIKLKKSITTKNKYYLIFYLNNKIPVDDFSTSLNIIFTSNTKYKYIKSFFRDGYPLNDYMYALLDDSAPFPTVSIYYKKKNVTPQIKIIKKVKF